MDNVIFLQPWILAGLAALPVLWFLLRVTPPAPRLIALPSARFLEGLMPEKRTPSKTPWWILLIRLLVAALVIAALARPVLNPGEALPGTGPVRLVIDNGWESAQGWDMRFKTVQDVLAQAGREKREIYILTTAPEPDGKPPRQWGPMGQAEAASILKGLSLQPWTADYALAQKTIEAVQPKDSTQSLWFSTGLNGAGLDGFMQGLQSQGGLGVYVPEPSALPLLLQPLHAATDGMSVNIAAPAAIPKGLPVSLQALAADGRVLDIKDGRLDPAALPQKAVFEMPEALRNDVASIRIAGRGGAGAILLLDESYRKRTVGIVSPPGEAESQPLIEASYYMKRALEPYATLSTGTIDDLVKANPSMIVLPDIGAMTSGELNTLEDWVKKGGMLVRFAGPHMARAENFLTPVPLRKGGRAMDGALTWDTPLHIAPFPKTSPFFGMSVPEEITVSRQLLAEPSADLDSKTWAKLEDGTPLMTAAETGKGMLVLVHTTATPAWSNLALSGLYVDLLRRMASISASPSSTASATGALTPLAVLDGRGALGEPHGNVTPIPAETFDTTVPGPEHPPGIYGRAGYKTALNLGARIEKIEALPDLPLSVTRLGYGKAHETDLMPLVLYGALMLLLLDWTIMIAMGAAGRFAPALRRSIATVAFLAVLAPAPLHAEPSAQDIEHANNLYLAYIRTGVSGVDSVTQRGLENLAQTLTNRTSAEPAGVVGLDPEKDDMAFFPLLYWAVPAEEKPPSDTALQKLQSYLDHGGTILFDMRDPHFSASANSAEALQRLIGALNVPPLIPAPKDHVLTKSFYLMDSFPGRYSGGTLWVEENSASGRDGVSSVIIGGNDWAGSWAQSTNGQAATQQDELALRFGVNLMMYALTGNYKADQVHIPHILERLGQ